MTGFSDQDLGKMAFQGDVEADEVVQRHASERPAASPQELVKGIAYNLILPPDERSAAIHAYLDEVPDLPSWHDPSKLEQGAEFFRCYGLEIAAALFCASLPEAYAGQRGSRVLTLTGRLVTDTVRRVNETAQMIINVAAPGGLEPGKGKGYRDARRVRLMHAAVRYLILEAKEVAKTDDPGAGMMSWSPAAGLPLCQEDMLATLLTFTTIPFAALSRLGVGYSPAEAEAYLHTWSVAGYLLGIDLDHPLGLDEANDLQARLMAKLQGPSPDAVQLGSALNGAMVTSLTFPELAGLPAAMITYLCGRDVAAVNGLHSDVLIAGFEPLHVALGLFGRELRHNPVVKFLIDRLTGALLTDFLHANRPGRPGFHMPDHLRFRTHRITRQWRI